MLLDCVISLPSALRLGSAVDPQRPLRISKADAQRRGSEAALSAIRCKSWSGHQFVVVKQTADRLLAIDRPQTSHPYTWGRPDQ